MAEKRLSDTHYREQAARQRRNMVFGLALVLLAALAVRSVQAVLHDTCTGSNDRAPRSVIDSYVRWVTEGSSLAAVACWDPHQYYELGAGCSEICLTRIVCIPYRSVEVTLGEPYEQDGRARINATVSTTCPQGDEVLTGEVVLDSVRWPVPWRHWKIVRSTFGGSVNQEWCR